MSDSRPFFSIVIATYNAAPTLPRCLDSIAAQSDRDFEVLVIDGGSTDGTTDVIRSRNDMIAYWHSGPDGGIYDAWNMGVTKARGEYICFLGADDMLHGPQSIQALRHEMGSNRFDLVSSLAHFINADSGSTQVMGRAWSHREIPRRFNISHPGLLHHRSLFDRHGLFSTRYRIAGDLEFLLRLPADIDTLHVDRVTVDIHDGGISRRQFWKRIGERRRVHAVCPRVGPLRAWLYWLDKVWRRPIALMLRLPH